MFKFHIEFLHTLFDETMDKRRCLIENTHPHKHTQKMMMMINIVIITAKNLYLYAVYQVAADEAHALHFPNANHM